MQLGTVPIGVYYLNVTASGQTRSHSVTLTLVVESDVKGNSSILIFVNPESQTLGNNVTISGAISPPHDAAITLQYARPEGLTFVKNLGSKSDGTFVYSFRPDALGQWTFSATWAGDKDHLGAKSAWVTINVSEPPTSRLSQFLKQLEAIPMEIVNAIAVLLAILLILSLFSGFLLVGIYSD